MKLLEIKNNLVKISYTTDEDVALAKFIAIADNERSYIAQIVNLKAEPATNYAIAKFLFTVSSDGIVDNYDGTIPSLKSELSYINVEDILNLLPMEKPVVIGKLAHQEDTLKIDEVLFEKNLAVFAEKYDNINILVNNFAKQLKFGDEKVVVIDTDYNFEDVKAIKFKRDFKLPLNSQMIDYIYDNDLAEVEPSTKAVIKDIFYEVQEYTKTLEGKFLPFENFLNVVTQQYQQTNIPELALLKHNLLRYHETSTFAQTKDEVYNLKTSIKSGQINYINIADAPDSLQTEIIKYIYNTLDEDNGYAYIFVKLTNNNSDKKLLKQIIENNHLFTTVVCSHSYRYTNELKQFFSNFILFVPTTLQHDFASYNTFLSKLNANEFVMYGSLTQNIPFIIELSELENFEPEVKSVNEPLDDDKSSAQVEFEHEDDTIEIQNNFDNVLSDDYEQPIVEDTNNIFENTISADDLPAMGETRNNMFENVLADDNEDLINQVAKDVDEVFYTNKTEEIPSIEEIAETDGETLTEYDLDFIDELPAQEYEEVPFVGEPAEDIPEEVPDLAQDVSQEAVQEEVITEEPIIEDIPTDFAEVEGETLENNTPATPEELTEEYIEADLPVYPAEEQAVDEELPNFAQGDTVTHPKYGTGVVEKLIKYGNKTLCSISFENVGRRLLDPAISEIQKV